MNYSQVEELGCTPRPFGGGSGLWRSAPGSAITPKGHCGGQVTRLSNLGQGWGVQPRETHPSRSKPRQARCPLGCWEGPHPHLDSAASPSGLQWKFPPWRSPLTKPESTSAPVALLVTATSLPGLGVWLLSGSCSRRQACQARLGHPGVSRATQGVLIISRSAKRPGVSSTQVTSH